MVYKSIYSGYFKLAKISKKESDLLVFSFSGVIPAKAGIQRLSLLPAFAGMTKKELLVFAGSKELEYILRLLQTCKNFKKGI